MKIQIEIPEDAVMGCAIAGSLYLTEGGKGNFRPYNRKPRSRKKKYRKLEHGSVAYGEEKITMYLSICHDEDVNAYDALIEEARKAKKWLEGISL